MKFDERTQQRPLTLGGTCLGLANRFTQLARVNVAYIQRRGILTLKTQLLQRTNAQHAQCPIGRV
ncbi:hypothetical protein WM23_04710 [Burkholderia ubonensis]|nr:hypothetical protein WM23_04710 [Burkholderia ubonensis]